jgi:hypothetical protein
MLWRKVVVKAEQTVGEALERRRWERSADEAYLQK